MRARDEDRAPPTVALVHADEGDRLLVLATNPHVRARLLAAGFVPARAGVLVAPLAPTEVPPCR